MPRLLLLTPTELTRDPRARRAAAAAQALGWEVAGLCGVTGETAVELGGVAVARVGRKGRVNVAHESGLPAQTRVRELRGLYRLARLGVRTVRLWRGGQRLASFDVVHANDLDTLPAGWLLARRGGARLVYDAHELYSAFEPDPPRIYRFLSTRLEARIARSADSVVTVSDPIADELVRRLRLAKRPLVVLNATELDPRKPEPVHEGPLRAIYQGAFGPGRVFSDLLDAIATAPGTHLTVRTVRSDLEELRAEVRARALDSRVEIAAPVTPDRLVESLRGFEVGLIFDRPQTRNSELSFPNKLFEYLMAGLAVVAPQLPGLAALIDGESLGLTFEPGSTVSLAATLEELAGDRTRLNELRRRARDAAVTRYNAEAQRERLAAAWGV